MKITIRAIKERIMIKKIKNIRHLEQDIIQYVNIIINLK
ncbi:unnamed protein product [Paramecium sonneborni]|uniref:Uncharacterized protein n=1 Tax=Paramecium sonneborni TaxID=65129 RepID=A0A8S1JW51_9CILI|nr:unnamed protein product [Paramecium sonneborni]